LIGFGFKTLVCCLIIMLTACANTSVTSDKTIKIVTMGSFWQAVGGEAFLNGAKLAAKEAAFEYGPLGYTIIHEFHDDGNDYSKGMLIVDELLRDNSLTALIGSQNLSILEMAAHRFENAGKLMIAPHGIANQVMAEKGHRYIFSTAFSSYDVGAAAKEYAVIKGIKRWAVCYHDDVYTRHEIRGFTEHKNNLGVEIMDYQKTSLTELNVDYIYRRWEALGVQGVFIAPGFWEGFNIVKLIRDRNKDIILMGDFAFDHRQAILDMNEEMRGFLMVNAFSTDRQKPEYLSFKDRYEKEYGNQLDTWAAHGYDAVRMVVDTAIKNQASHPEVIANALREDGHQGLAIHYSFRENGELAPGFYSIARYSDGEFEDIKVYMR